VQFTLVIVTPLGQSVGIASFAFVVAYLLLLLKKVAEKAYEDPCMRLLLTSFLTSDLFSRYILCSRFCPG
jgi:hypothetical protein